MKYTWLKSKIYWSTHYNSISFDLPITTPNSTHYNSKLHNYLTDYFMKALKWFMNFALVDIKVIYHAS